MKTQSTLSLILFSFFFLFTLSTAFDITKMLKTYSDFSTFNDYLTQTQLAQEINRRETITVLAVDNSGMSQLSGKSQDVIKRVMGLHVILDYYDVSKLQKLSNKTALLTTLFQSTGLAVGQQGFLNVTDMSSGEVAFGSAVKGSSLDSKLVKSIVAQPYNISVLQISSIIVPTGIENSNNNSTHAPPPPPPPPHKATAPSPATSPSKAPAGSPPPKSAKAPAPSKKDDASSPTADSPSEVAADSPKVSSPPSPVPSSADAPLGDNAADAPATADAPASSKKSSGTRASFGVFVAGFMVVVSSFWVAL